MKKDKEITDTEVLNWIEKHLLEYKPARYDGNLKGRFDLYWESDITDIREAVKAEIKRNTSRTENN